MAYQFEPIRSLRLEAPEPPAGDPGPSGPVAGATQKVLGNLLGHIPTEAVALSTSLAPLIVGKDNSLLRAWIVFGGSLLLTVLVRALNKASVGIWVTSMIAFVLWMDMVPGSALQQSYPSDPIVVVMIAAIFSAVVTVLGSAGILK